MTALNVLNGASLCVSVVLLAIVLRVLNATTPWVLGGGAMFVFSFPVFYYGSIGLVDPVLLMFLLLGLWSTLRGQWLMLGLAVVFGAMVKEAIILLLPVLAARLLFVQVAPWRRLGILVLVSMLAWVALQIPRQLMPVDPYHWVPSLDRLMTNAVRPRTWMSALLSLGVPGLLLVGGMIRGQGRRSFHTTRDTALPLMVGVLTSLALFGYSLVTAYADGRFIWMGYPFLIPLAVMVWNDRIVDR
jgi:hypothetical protein